MPKTRKWQKLDKFCPFLDKVRLNLNYYISISSMQNILEWSDKSGPHRKSFTKRKRAPKFDNKLLCVASLLSASALIVKS